MLNHAYSANIVLRKNFQKNDGTNPLVLRVIVNRKVIDMSLDISVFPNEYDQETQLVKLKEKKKTNDTNLLLQHYKAKASDIFTNHKLMDVPLTTDMFKYEFENEIAKYDFIEFMDKAIVEEKNGDKEAGTISGYKQTLFWLKLYFKDGFKFSEITPENMEKFHRFQRGKKLKPNTIHKHKKNILKFINVAIRKGIRIESPYETLKISKVPTNKDSLTKEHLIKLIEIYNTKECPTHLQNVLAMFIFSAVCGGIRFSDLQAFTQENIIENTLVFIPQKLKRFNRVVKVPIPEYALDFIQNNKGKMFDKISNANANLYLKIIQHIAKIPVLLTTHVARHTFATLFLEADGEVYTLMDIMGISKFETIKVYIHIASSRKKDLMNKYNKFISN